MKRFDLTCGLSTKKIRIVKFNAANLISRKLPLLPDSVETRLFLQGRDAWIFRWHSLNEKLPISSDEKISFEVVSILKKSFINFRLKLVIGFHVMQFSKKVMYIIQNYQLFKEMYNDKRTVI
jgi:hypothetical protein